MSLRLRLLVLFTVLVLVVAFAAAAVTVALRNVEANRSLVTQSLQPASVQSRALLVALIDQETGERGYLLAGDDRFLQPYRHGRREFADRLAELRGDFRGDPGMTAALDRVAAAADTWRRVGPMPEIRARQSGGARPDATSAAAPR